MKLEKKLISIVGLCILCLGLFFYNVFLKNDVKTAKEEYIKLFNDIEMIRSLDAMYGTKESNEKNIEKLLNQYKEKLVFKKINTNNIEFKLSKLSSNEFDSLVKSLVDNNYKIAHFKAKKLDVLNAELECKVLF